MTSKSANQLIKTYIAQKQWSSIIDLCQQHLNQNPNRIELYPVLAKAYANQGLIAEAIATYQQALDTPLNQAEVHAELGLLHSKQQQLVKAAWHYQQALMIDAEWAELQYNLAIILYQLGDWDKSLAAYKEALRIKPDYAAVYFNLGVLYDSRGELETASNYYQQAIELEPRYLKAYSNLSSTLAKQQKYSTAIQILKQGLEIDPTWSTLHNNLGQIYFLDRQFDRALASFEMAICLEPTMSLAYSNLSKLWQQRGNWERVVKSLQKLIDLEPTNVAAFGNLAGVLLRQGNSAAAIKYLRQAIALEPRFVKSYCTTNQTSDPTDLLSVAKEACVKFLTALQTDAPDAEVIEYLWQTYSKWGDFLSEQGKLVQAETYYCQGLDVKPDEIALYLSLGNALVAQNKWDAAISIYNRGLVLQPHHEQITHQLHTAVQNQQLCLRSTEFAKNTVSLHTFSRTELTQASEESSSLERTSSDLPQAIYDHTHDWIRDCQVEDYGYTEVFWEGTKPDTNRVKQTAVKIEQLNSDRSESANLDSTDSSAKLMAYFQPIDLGNQAYQCFFRDVPEIAAPLPFVAIIPQGKVWYGQLSNSDSYALAVITPDRYLLKDLAYSDRWKLPSNFESKQVFDAIYQQKQLSPTTKLEGKVALLSGLASNSYDRWLLEILPRLELIRLSNIDLDSIDWFLFDSTEQPFQAASLSYLDIPLTKVVTSNQNPIIEAQELIVPSFPGYSNWIPFGTIKFLRQTFLPKIGNLKIPQQPRIYVSKRRAKDRNIANEAAIADFLAQFGFQTVYLEEMSLIEQVALFANAKIVVASHSPQLSNLVFCSPKTIVVELFSPHYLRTKYWVLSQQLDLRHYYCVGESFDCLPLQNIMYQNSLAEDTLINLNSLELVFQAARVSD